MGNAAVVCCICKYVHTAYVTCLCDAYVADSLSCSQTSGSYPRQTIP